MNVHGSGNGAPSARSHDARKSINSCFSAGESTAAADSISASVTIRTSVHRTPPPAKETSRPPDRLDKASCLALAAARWGLLRLRLFCIPDFSVRPPCGIRWMIRQRMRCPQSSAGVRSSLTVSSLQDSHERQVFVERRPVQPKWRDFDTAHIFLGSGFQPRVALGGKTHLMAAGEPDKDHPPLMPCLEGTVSQGARPISV